MDITRKELEAINNALVKLESLRMTEAQRDSFNLATNTIAAVFKRADNAIKKSMMPKPISEAIQESIDNTGHNHTKPINRMLQGEAIRAIQDDIEAEFEDRQLREDWDKLAVNQDLEAFQREMAQQEVPVYTSSAGNLNEQADNEFAKQFLDMNQEDRGDMGILTDYTGPEKS